MRLEAKSTIGRTLQRVVPRRHLVRAGRSLERLGRLDVTNDMSKNGELALVEHVCDTVARDSMRFIDVGGNVGRWTGRALELAKKSGKRALVDVFEPWPATATVLREKFAEDSCVTVHELAVSDEAGSREFLSFGDSLGINGFYEVQSVEPVDRAWVGQIRLDQFAATSEEPIIDYLKIDTEGNDYQVLAGSVGLLALGSVRFAQFEYNYRWVFARRFLKDVFDLCDELPYSVGKVTPHGVELYSGWHPELEHYIEGNFVLVHDPEVADLPLIEWWLET